MNSVGGNKTEKKRNLKFIKIFIIKKTKKFNFWSTEEDKLLLDLTTNLSQKNWVEISKKFKNKSSVQCSARYLKIKPGIKKGHWSPEEDTLISDYVNKYGTKWSHISKVMSNRTGKQIRDRYLNYLDHKIKRDRFSEDEDMKLRELYIKYGSKWTKISKLIERRTPEMVKNRFYSFLKSKIHINEKRSNMKILRLCYNKKKKSSYLNIKKDNSLSTKNIIENTIDVIYINCKESENMLLVCSTISFTIFGNTNITNYTQDLRDIKYPKDFKFNIEDVNNFIENPLNINKLAYYYLENYEKMF